MAPVPTVASSPAFCGKYPDAMSHLSRTLVAALAACGVVASSLFAAGAARAAVSPTPSLAATEAVAPGSPTITAVIGGTGSGQLVVTYAPPAGDGGTPVTSYEISVDAGVTWWVCAPTPGSCTLTSLNNGRPYSVILRAVNAIGAGLASAPSSGVPSIPAGADPDKPATLPKPRAWVNASFNAASNDLGVDGSKVKLGVGTLPQLTFTRAIPDKRVVESHLTVNATLEDGRTRPVKGSWGWMDDRSVVFRPVNYWPGHATITITSTLDRAVLGKSGGTYLVGSSKLGAVYTFRTARKLIIKVNGSTDRMKVYIDGKKVKDFGVSLGKADWETRNGVKVISTQKEPTHTYTSTALNLDPSVEAPYELKDIPWNTRLTPTGEFMHSAPWAYGRIGRYNGSHGCTNMFESDAKWIYDKTIPGDVAIYTKTGGEVVPAWNGPGGLWNITWDRWLKKSALASATGNPDTTDPSQPLPGDTTDPVGA